MTPRERSLLEALKALLDAMFALTSARSQDDAMWLAAMNNKLRAVQQAKAEIAAMEQDS